MTDSNIVAGLRTDAALFGKMPPHAKVNMNPEFMREMSQLWIAAADEIERLRAGGCARDQKTTQFCAEAVTLQREVEMLREMVAEMRERNNKLLHRLQEYEAREAE